MDAGAIREALVRAARPGLPRLDLLDEVPDTSRTIGLVPGSFDPMTIAHAALVEALATDNVLLVYSPATLAKEAGPGGVPSEVLLEPGERVASLLAYARGRPAVGVALCSHGLYADQAVAVGAAFPGARLVFGMGSDKVLQLLDPAWYEDRQEALERLFSIADVAYALRRGDGERVAAALAAEPRWAGGLRALELPPKVAAVSSRTVREAVRRGADVRRLVPEGVRPFLEARPSPKGA